VFWTSFYDVDSIQLVYELRHAVKDKFQVTYSDNDDNFDDDNDDYYDCNNYDYYFYEYSGKR
jgi:hypothetical protein